MCRYGSSIYKEHWACFHCRKMFRKPQPYDRKIKPYRGRVDVAPCPQCKRPMANMGLDFKAPKQRDVRQWEKVRILFAHGYKFNSCGCNGPGYRPKTLRELPEFFRQEDERAANASS